jgi:hypothetical protein
VSSHRLAQWAASGGLSPSPRLSPCLPWGGAQPEAGGRAGDRRDGRRGRCGRQGAQGAALVNRTQALVNRTQALVNRTQALVNRTQALVNRTQALVNRTQALVNRTQALVNRTQALVNRTQALVNRTQALVNRTQALLRALLGDAHDAAAQADANRTLRHAVLLALSGPSGTPYSDEKVANRDLRDFGWEIAHDAVSRRPPISFYTIVPRTGGYTYDVGVWDSFIIQGPFSVAPCQTLA